METEDLTELKNFLARPQNNRKTTRDGSYDGETVHAAFDEKDDKFNGGTRTVLNLGYAVVDDDGELVRLYQFLNYNWNERSNMFKTLEKLGKLPKPGENIQLSELVGIPVRIRVENVVKNGETYSNVISVQKIEKNNSHQVVPTNNPIRKTADDDFSDFD